MKQKPHLPLVKLRGVRLTLGGRLVLRDVSWSIQRGEGWLVTGPNGAGKTSLLRIVAGRIWPDPGPRGGKRLYHFSRCASESPIGLEGRIAWLSPETHQRFARLDAPFTAGDAILTGFAGTFLLTHLPMLAQRAVARRLAEKLGLAKLWKQPFAELSQGQQRLVLLARALAPKPTLLVLDEFSDSLDDAARKRVSDALRRRLLAGAAVVVATHRQGDFLPGLQHHLVLRAGQAAEALLPTRIRNSHDRIPQSGMHSKSHIPSPTARSILRLVNASVFIGDHKRVKQILHGITWVVMPDEHWVVLGANGSGKSTLLRAIYGELPIARGGVLERFGRGAKALPLPQARQKIGFVSPALQHNYTADASVGEVVASGFRSSIGLLPPSTRAELKAAQQALRKLGLSKLFNRRWGELSFGEARLVLLARALVLKPRLLLLDEPCDGLAPAARGRFLRAVERVARAGAQVIVAAHRAEDIPKCVNRVLKLSRGRVAG